MSLPDWATHRWIVEHETDLAEITELFAVVDRDLDDAALQLATLALAAAGYRPAREASPRKGHSLLRYTVGEAARALRREVVRWLRKRHAQFCPKGLTS